VTGSQDHSCSGDPARPAYHSDPGYGCSDSGHTPGTAADANSVSVVPGVTTGVP
jgi:hypothetical protein